MLGRKFLGLAAAVIAIASSTQTASAATVTYSTTGLFQNNSTQITSTPSGATLTFAGQPSTTTTTIDGVPEAINLGQFTLTTPTGSTNLFSFPNATFTLTVSQTAPSAGTAPAQTAAITGTVTSGAPGLPPGSLTITFAPTATFTIGGVVYNPDDATIIPGGTLSIRALAGTVTSPPVTAGVPLPAAVWGGMALFGLVGTMKARRRLAA